MEQRLGLRRKVQDSRALLCATSAKCACCGAHPGYQVTIGLARVRNGPRARVRSRVTKGRRVRARVCTPARRRRRRRAPRRLTNRRRLWRCPTWPLQASLCLAARPVTEVQAPASRCVPSTRCSPATPCPTATAECASLTSVRPSLGPAAAAPCAVSLRAPAARLRARARPPFFPCLRGTRVAACAASRPVADSRRCSVWPPPAAARPRARRARRHSLGRARRAAGVRLQRSVVAAAPRRQGASPSNPTTQPPQPLGKKQSGQRPASAVPRECRSRHPQAEKKSRFWVRAGSASFEPPLNHRSDRLGWRSAAPPIPQALTLSLTDSGAESEAESRLCGGGGESPAAAAHLASADRRAPGGAFSVGIAVGRRQLLGHGDGGAAVERARARRVRLCSQSPRASLTGRAAPSPRSRTRARRSSPCRRAWWSCPRRRARCWSAGRP